MSKRTGVKRGRPQKISSNPDQLSLEYQDDEYEFIYDEQLSPLQNLFANEYAKTGHGGKSYLKVYMPDAYENPTPVQLKYASERACHIKKNKNVQKTIRELTKQRQRKSELTADKIISSLWDLYNAGVSGIKYKRKVGDTFEQFVEYNLNTALGALKELKTHKSVANEFKANSDVTVNISLSERMKRCMDEESNNA